jgi:hypothetical protein
MMSKVIQFDLEKEKLEFKIAEENPFKFFENVVNELCIMFEIKNKKDFKRDFENMIIGYEVEDVNVIRDMKYFFDIIEKYAEGK